MRPFWPGGFFRDAGRCGGGRRGGGFNVAAEGACLEILLEHALPDLIFALLFTGACRFGGADEQTDWPIV